MGKTLGTSHIEIEGESSQVVAKLGVHCLLLPFLSFAPSLSLSRSLAFFGKGKGNRRKVFIGSENLVCSFVMKLFFFNCNMS